MKLPDTLLKNRLDIEKGINSLIGGGVSVYQLMLSSTSCGCVGLTLFPVGLKREDVEVFNDMLLPQLKEISKGVGVFPGAIVIQTRADDSEIAKVKIQRLCKSCKIDYKGAEGKPWPGVYTLQYNPTDDYQPNDNDFLVYRSEIEGKIRKMSGKLVNVEELGVFVLSCGCSGFLAALSGLKAGDITGKDLSFFKKMSSDLGIEPKIMYAALSYGTDCVSSITSKNTCSICKVKYEKGVILPDLVL